MPFSRRQFLAGAGAVFIGGWGAIGTASAASPAVAFLDKSQLIYLCPLLTRGDESTCHAEVWFVHYKEEIYIVTKADAWRAEAIRRGLRFASIWIGEFGPWKKAENRYRSAPHLTIEGRFETDTAAQSQILDVYGVKYADEWGSWGPRFKQGLADGTRVMLRYQIAA